MSLLAMLLSKNMIANGCALSLLRVCTACAVPCPNTIIELTMAARKRDVSNGNRTEWSPIRSVIIRVITKSDDRAAGVQFVYHEYDYRPNWTTRSPIAN